MRLSTAVKLAAIAAVALMVGVVAAVKSMDFNRIKGVVSEQVRATTGRNLVIAGPLELRLGLVPRIIATGITLSNAPGGSRAEMVKIERAEAEISLLPLLKREIRVNRLIVSSPDILVETDAKGRGNWEFTPAPADAKDAKPTASGAGVPNSRFTLREVKIKNATLTWRDGRTGASRVVNLHKFAVQPDQTPTGPLSVQVVGETQSKLFELSGRLGNPAALSPSKPWPLQVKANVDGMVLVAEGSIADPLNLRGMDLKLAAQGDELGKALKLANPASTLAPGPFKLSGHLSDASGKLAVGELDMAVGKRDALLLSARGTIKDALALAGVELAVTLDSDNLAGLSRLTGTEFPSMGPLKVSGLLNGGGTEWKLADIKAALAGSSVAGELALNATHRPRLTGKLVAATLSLADFATPAAKAGEKLAPKHLKPTDDGRLFSAEALPLHLLSQADADVALVVGKLDTGTLSLTDVTASIHLAGGRLALKPVRALMAGGQMEGEATLDANGKAPAAMLRLTARQVDLGRMIKDAGSDALTGGRSDARLELSGHGASIRALMASATGEAVVSVGEGRLHNKAVDWAGGDVMFQVLGALNPLGRHEDTTPLTCAVARFVVKDGMATSTNGIAVETAKVNVVGAGTVNLRNEALDLGVTPRARDGIGLSLSSPLAGMTRIRGTLAEPSLGVDELGTLRTAASAGAAVATGGLSLLGELLVDKFTADSTPCRTALGQPAPRSPAKKSKKTSAGPLESLFGR
ncbi:MAG: AsmA family protein [Rhodospirillaceae bacterium]|nr:AsmA family protein [Rhodospirillales bacterium]